MSASPKLSIIIATLNSADNLGTCLESIASQTCQDLEVLVVDGGSEDETCSVIKNFDKIISFTLSESDHGIYDAWNKALPFAKGEWVYFLGADDRLYSHTVFATALPLLDRLPTSTFLAYGQVIITGGEAIRYEYLYGLCWQKVGKRFFCEMTIPHQGVFHRRTTFDRFGTFDTSYKCAGDYDLLLRVVSETEPIFLEDTIIAYHSLGGISTDPFRNVEILWENRRAQKKIGARSFCFWMILPKTYIKMAFLKLLPKSAALRIVDWVRYRRAKKRNRRLIGTHG